MDAVVADYRDSRALTGYLLYDEPRPRHFATLGRQIARLRQIDPGRVALVPLFPMHDDPRFPGNFEGRPYEQYLRDFVVTCRPSVLAYDYYPFMDPAARMPQFDENFAIARRVADEHGLPLWYYPAIVQGATIGRLRYQVNLALAHGARALLHYTYHAPDRLSDEELRTVNRETASLLAATRGLPVQEVRIEGDRTVAVFGAGEARLRLEVNRDVEDGRAALRAL